MIHLQWILNRELWSYKLIIYRFHVAVGEKVYFNRNIFYFTVKWANSLLSYSVYSQHISLLPCLAPQNRLQFVASSYDLSTAQNGIGRTVLNWVLGFFFGRYGFWPYYSPIIVILKALLAFIVIRIKYKCCCWKSRTHLLHWEFLSSSCPVSGGLQQTGSMRQGLG